MGYYLVTRKFNAFGIWKNSYLLGLLRCCSSSKKIFESVLKTTQNGIIIDFILNCTSPVITLGEINVIFYISFLPIFLNKNKRFLKKLKKHK